MPSAARHATDATDVAGRLRFSVVRLARILRQQDQSGFTPTTLAALSTIARNGPLTLGDLAALEQVAPPTVTKSVAKLEQAGFVRRQQDPDDRRIHRVEVTAEGAAQLDEARSRRTAWLATRLATFTPEDLERLADVLDLLERLTVVDCDPALRPAATGEAPDETPSPSPDRTPGPTDEPNPDVTPRP